MTVLLAFAAILGGLVLLVWSADKFVQGAAATAYNLGVSTMVIGLVVIGFGTSAPEMLVSATAALQGNPQLAVGNALGSNIANIALVLGATAVIMPLEVKSETLRREYPIMFIVMLVALFLMSDLTLSRLDGVILIAGLVGLMAWMVWISQNKSKGKADPLLNEMSNEIPKLAMKPALLWLIVGLILLLVSSKILVWGAIIAAKWMGMSDLVIGLTVIAIGTSLPELAASIMSAIKKEPDLAIGNIIGSNMFNILAVLGISSSITNTPITHIVITRDFGTMLGLTIALFIMAYGFKRPGRINRPEGMILLLCYLAYLAILYLTEASVISAG